MTPSVVDAGAARTDRPPARISHTASSDHALGAYYRRTGPRTGDDARKVARWPAALRTRAPLLTPLSSLTHSSTAAGLTRCMCRWRLGQRRGGLRCRAPRFAAGDTKQVVPRPPQSPTGKEQSHNDRATHSVCSLASAYSRVCSCGVLRLHQGDATRWERVTDLLCAVPAQSKGGASTAVDILPAGAMHEHARVRRRCGSARRSGEKPSPGAAAASGLGGAPAGGYAGSDSSRRSAEGCGQAWRARGSEWGCPAETGSSRPCRGAEDVVPDTAAAVRCCKELRCEWCGGEGAGWGETV